MENGRWAVALAATVIGMGCVTAQAQMVQSQAQNPSMQPNQTAPMSVQSAPMSTQPATMQNQSSSMFNQSAPMSAASVGSTTLGQDQTVSYNNKFLGIGFGKTIAKKVTMEPGNHQISLDGVKNRDQINLTLVNPSATPLQFETTQRWGKQVVAVVPPHSQQMVAFTKARPLTHEIRYSIMQQPSNAISSNQDYVTQQAAAVADVEHAAYKNDLDQQTAMMRQSQDQQTAQLQDNQKQVVDEAIRQYQQSHGTSAVRGYW